jgi:hypothetical protein
MRAESSFVEGELCRTTVISSAEGEPRGHRSPSEPHGGAESAATANERRDGAAIFPTEYESRGRGQVLGEVGLLGIVDFRWSCLHPVFEEIVRDQIPNPPPMFKFNPWPILVRGRRDTYISSTPARFAHFFAIHNAVFSVVICNN